MHLLARARSTTRSTELRTALDACDASALAGALHDQQLLASLGTRAVAAWGGAVPPAFAEAVEATVAANRSRGLALEALSAAFVERLAAAGVRTLVLKGPLQARRLHGDVGFRSSNDVDLLVRPEEFAAAAQALAPLGYAVEESVPVRSHGLPDLHAVLRSPAAGLPRIDLHWRVHWYEAEFSADLLARSRQGDSVFLEPEPGDELATLMLLYARDGFYGLRMAVDIAAWWDLHAPGASRPLERHWRRYPQLRRTLVAAALATERAIGIPAAELAPAAALGRLTPRLAANLSSWNQLGDIDQLRENVAVVDALLSPLRELRHFARRELFVTRAEIESMYGLPASARRRVTALRLIHAPKVTLRYIAGLWSAFRPPREKFLGEQHP